MTDHFSEHGRRLLANGYLILPIKPGEKRPAIQSWQKARIGDSDLGYYPHHGVGVLCGQGPNPVVGIDIDISHPAIGPAIIEWCHRVLGCTAERVGAAPRVLLVYRAAETGWAKGNSIKFFDETDPEKASGKPNEQQVEILGLGQQFVAYHVHPDTGIDYQWTDLFGGITNIPVRDLPIITEAHIDALMAEMDRLVRATAGLTILSAGSGPQLASNGSLGDLMSITPPTDTPLAEIESLLGYLDNSGIGQDYDTWIKVGMALHHEYQGGEAALKLWKTWGATSAKDDPGKYDYKWASFSKSQRQPTTLRWLLKICHQAKREHDLQAQRDVLEQIKAKIAAADDSFVLKSEVAKQIKALMPDDGIVQTEVYSAFKAKFRELSEGVVLPISEIKKLLAPSRVAQLVKEPTRRQLTEFGNAERMLDTFGASLMYVPEITAWYIWRDGYWHKAVDVEIEHYAKLTIKNLIKEVDEHPEPAEFFQFCSLSQQAKMVRNMVSLASSDPRVVVSVKDLDADPNLIGVENGVVKIDTLTLLPPDPNYRITKIMGAPYIADAKCPLFEQTLSEVFSGDKDMVSFLQRLVGYAACGQPTEDFMVIPFGNGANGKSTIFNAIRVAFGHYARAADASSFVTDGKGGGSAGGAREDLLRLKGARLVYASEPDEGGELREGMVKSMTGGDAIAARGLYSKESVEITPTWVVVMPTNHKPIIKGTDNGIWRRLMLLPFERNFEVDGVKDPKREEKLRAEMTGILAWILRGANLYKHGGLAQPASVKQARESYRSQMDLLAEWLDECCEISADYKASVSELWESWEGYAKKRGLANYVRSSVALGRRLDARFPAMKGTGGTRYRIGLRLADPFRV